jgi:FtsP/CotA-like multicopper oxidase with cupredoxin domain
MFWHGNEWFGYLNGEKYDENVEMIPAFEVENGEYRFRIINGDGQAKNGLIFGIDGHKLTVVSTDAYPVEPYETDMIQLGVAERYDVMVKFDIKTTAENFWIRALTSTKDGGQKNHRVLGILRVRKNTNYDHNPSLPQNKNMTVDFTKIRVLNCHETNGCKNGNLVTDLISSPKIKKRELLDSFEYHIYDNKRAESYTKENKVWEVSIDNGPYHQNHIPCESGLMKSAKDRWSNSTHVLHLSGNKSVTIAMRNLTPKPHPMHIHGHHFEVLEIATGQNNVKDEIKECKGLLSLDTAFSEPIDRLMKRKRQGVLKDSVILPECGAVAVRINTDNPGVWFFHCHFPLHLHRGMALVIDEGGYLFSQPNSAFPSDYPSCEACNDEN